MEAANSAESPKNDGREERKPKIPVELMVPIFSFLPTYELIRFVSNCEKKPLGRFWSVGLKIVVEQRLPFSLETMDMAGVPSESHLSYAKLYDCNRDMFATVKRPIQFRASALCDLIEDARVSVVLRPNESHVLDGKEFEGIFSNLRTLTLVVYTDTSGFARSPSEETLDRELFSAPLHNLLQQLQSLTIIDQSASFRIPLGIAADFRQMTNLEMLDVSNEQFMVLAQDSAGTASSSTSNQEENIDVLSQLICLKLRYPGLLDQLPHLVPIFSARCTGLREVFLSVQSCDIVNSCFPAFRALPVLSKVGLELGLGRRRDRVAANDNVPNVTELLLKLPEIFNIYPADEGEAAETPARKWPIGILPNFPNVEKLSVQYGDATDVMQLAAKICRTKLLPQLKALKCFTSNWPSPALDLNDLRLFLLEPGLPRKVDVSPIVFQQFAAFRQWSDLCRMMQENPVISLRLCGPLSSTALHRFRQEIVEDPATYGECKIVTWHATANDMRHIPSDFTLQQIAAFAARLTTNEPVTDFKLTGRKNAGVAKDEQFTVRFFHPSEVAEVIF